MRRIPNESLARDLFSSCSALLRSPFRSSDAGGSSATCSDMLTYDANGAKSGSVHAEAR